MELALEAPLVSMEGSILELSWQLLTFEPHSDEGHSRNLDWDLCCSPSYSHIMDSFAKLVVEPPKQVVVPPSLVLQLTERLIAASSFRSLPGRFGLLSFPLLSFGYQLLAKR